jgi:hypothetical protein
MGLSNEQPPEDTTAALKEYLGRRFTEVSIKLDAPGKFHPRHEPVYKPQIGDLHFFNDPANHSYDAQITSEGFWGYQSTGWVKLG